MQREKIRKLTYTALMTVIIAICAWITIPAGPVPFTLQTFGVFAALGLLGGAWGTVAVLVYLLLGAVGVPVFSGMSGGIGVLLGPTGGYLIGFIFTALVYWLITKAAGHGAWSEIAGMVAGLLVCYAFGTAWFIFVYSAANGSVTLAAALGWCVIPFILPDLVKIGCAFALTKAVRKAVKGLAVFS